MPLDDPAIYVVPPPPLDLTELEIDLEEEDDQLLLFLLKSIVSCPGELSPLWTTLVLPWTISPNGQIELQEELKKVAVLFFEGSWIFESWICLQLSKFLIWFHEEDDVWLFFWCFFFRLDSCFLATAAACSGGKLRTAMKCRRDRKWKRGSVENSLCHESRVRRKMLLKFDRNFFNGEGSKKCR